MRKGARLLLYSDGVTEAMNSSSEMYGVERLRQHGSAPATSIPTLLLELSQFAAGAPASDDITIVMVEPSARLSTPCP